jgi:mannosidase alpha-like ER degradation enhancer 1
MKWRYWPEALVALLVVVIEGSRRTTESSSASTVYGPGWSSQRRIVTRCVAHRTKKAPVLIFLSERVRELWYHGYDHYMKHGEFSHLNYQSKQ